MQAKRLLSHRWHTIDRRPGTPLAPGLPLPMWQTAGSRFLLPHQRGVGSRKRIVGHATWLRFPALFRSESVVSQALSLTWPSGIPFQNSPKRRLLAASSGALASLPHASAKQSGCSRWEDRSGALSLTWLHGTL